MNMKTEFINDSEDMEWLLRVHLPLVERYFLKGSAILVGNEDCPNQIRLYGRKEPNLIERAHIYEYDQGLEKYFYAGQRSL